MDTLYAYIQYFETKYKKQFSNIKRKFYDSHFEYRFLYNLRNYIIHEDLGILTINKLFGNGEKEIKFLVSKDKLAKAEKVQKIFKIELSQLEMEDFDIYPIITNFKKILLDLQIDIINVFRDGLLTAFSLLMDNVPNQQDVFLLKDGEIINSLLNVTTKFYENFAKNFVYSEKLMESENDVKTFFMRISFLYYKEKK